MSAIDDLHTVFSAYCAATGLAEATVSSRFLGRGGRYADLSAGGDMGARHIQRVLTRFSEQWPDAVDWPSSVVRPAARASVVGLSGDSP